MLDDRCDQTSLRQLMVSPASKHPLLSTAPASADVTPLLTELATARVRAAAELRALREGMDEGLLAVWLEAVHDAAALLVSAGKARVHL